MDISDSDDDKDILTQEIIQPFNDNSTINNYKILADIKQLGCSSKGLNAATYRTYLDLCEVRKYEEVSYHYLSSLDILYLKALKKKEENETEIIVPVLSSKKISFKQIEDLQTAFESSSIKLAICDSNALIMYYNVTKS